MRKKNFKFLTKKIKIPCDIFHFITLTNGSTFVHPPLHFSGFHNGLKRGFFAFEKSRGFKNQLP